MNKNEIIMMKQNCVKGLNKCINAQIMIIEMARAGYYSGDECVELFGKFELQRMDLISSFKYCNMLLENLM